MLLNTLKKLRLKYDDQEEEYINTGVSDGWTAQGSVNTYHRIDSSHAPSNLKHWKQSGSVVILFAFLKEYNDQGFFLQQTKEGGKSVLSFDPGLKGKEQDPERWDLALDAGYLMDQARRDLYKLISNGHLTLPEYKGIWL